MFRLPPALRSEFQKPFGPVVQGHEIKGHLRPGDVVLAVGDLVSKTAIELGLHPRLIVVDFATERRPVDPGVVRVLRGYGDRVVRLANPPATVTDELYAACVAALAPTTTTRIEVEGEEDLAGLPLFAEAPLGTVILYGMPGQGVVVVRNGTRMKSRARDLLARMSVPPGPTPAGPRPPLR